MSTDIQTSEKLTFSQLSQKHRIEIPIIQRDYAQGRKDNAEIRERFLISIFEAFSGDKPLELDFVYGSVNDDCMKPLDGQQRLTTLFLLHWYFANKENKLLESAIILQNFTYETRTSSREFCLELILKGIDFNNLLPADIDLKGKSKNNQLSKTIIDTPWFFLTWKNDPTIKAMLIMLDSIHKKATDTKIGNDVSIWSKLIEKNIISFNYIELKHFGLSDDLYIKMNARGKALTTFENFKASFENKIKNEGWEDINLKPTQRFIHKTDTVWTDLFWTVRDTNNLIDHSFIKIIASNLLICIALSKKPKEEKELRIREILNNPNSVRSDDFDIYTFNYLAATLDIYSDAKEKILIDFIVWDFLNEELNFFDTIAKGDKIEYQKIVFYYAQTQYLLKNNQIENANFSNWLRVIRNIIFNSTIDSAETFTNAIKLIDELSAGSGRIYKYISENEIKSKFAQSQIKEEIIKSKLICFNEIFKESIFNTEDTNFCKGHIMFALDCIEYDKTDINTFSPDKLLETQKVINFHLSGDDITNDFRRGLFTIDDNRFYDYWNTSWLYAVDAPKRCLIENSNDLKNYAYNPGFKKYLLQLLQKLAKKELEEIIESYEIPTDMANWKKRIIKEKGLLDYSNKHYLAIKEDECCWLIPGSKVANNKEGVKKCKHIS